MNTPAGPRLRLARVLVAALCAILVVRCGDGDTRVEIDPPALPSPSSGVPVRGTERLAWDQAAPSYQRLQQYGFRIYVDGQGTVLPGAECLDSSSGGAFPCSAPLPPVPTGTHTIQVAAVAAGVEGARSNSITVTMNQGRTVIDVRDATGTKATNADDTQALVVCLDPAVCFRLRRVVTRAGPVSSPASLPDGRLLFVENGRQVRTVVSGAVLEEPALTVAEGSRIVALLADPAFATNRVVRLAWIRQSASSGRELGVTRARELNGRLGEAAVVVPAIAIADAGEPRAAQDDAGRLYVALPGDDSPPSPPGGPTTRVLRFSPEGLTWSADLGPPLFARVADHPHAIAIDSTTDRLWLAGRDRRGAGRLRSFPLTPPGAGAPSAGTTIEATAARPIVSLASWNGRGSEIAGLLIVDDDGRVAWTGAVAFRPLPSTVLSGQHVLEVVRTADGALMTTRSTEGTGPLYSVFRLEPVVGP